MQQLYPVLENKSKILFNIPRYTYYGAVYYESSGTQEIFLYIIHCEGIIKYNMDTKTILERFRSPMVIYQVRNTYTSNQYCLDVNNNIIYINNDHHKKVISFNIATEEWHDNIYSYGKEDSNVIMSKLSFFGQPLNIVRFMLVDFRTDFIGIFNEWKELNPDYMRNMSINQCKSIQVLEEKIIENYDEEQKKWIVTYFKTKIVGINNDDIDELITLLFSKQYIQDKARHYQELVLTETIWGQIIFFVFRIYDHNAREYFYCIDCVDLFDPLVIHFNIVNLPYTAGSIIHINTTGILYYVDSIESKHYELQMEDHLPAYFVNLHKSLREENIIKVTQYMVRKAKCIEFPLCLLKFIFTFCPLFT